MGWTGVFLWKPILRRHAFSVFLSVVLIGKCFSRNQVLLFGIHSLFLISGLCHLILKLACHHISEQAGLGGV